MSACLSAFACPILASSLRASSPSAASLLSAVASSSRSSFSSFRTIARRAFGLLMPGLGFRDLRVCSRGAVGHHRRRQIRHWRNRIGEVGARIGRNPGCKQDRYRIGHRHGLTAVVATPRHAQTRRRLPRKHQNGTKSGRFSAARFVWKQAQNSAQHFRRRRRSRSIEPTPWPVFGRYAPRGIQS